MNKTVIITAIMIVAAFCYGAVILSYDFDSRSANEYVAYDTVFYDYTRNAVFEATNKLENTLAFNAGVTTDYIIQNRGAGHEKCLFLNGGADPSANYKGIYLMNIDMTADGNNASRPVIVEWSFDILGASNDVDFDPAGWTVTLNYANTSPNMDITDGWFDTNYAGRVTVQTFSFTNAGFSGTSGWTTVRGSYEIPVGEAGNMGAFQIRTRNGGWVSSGMGLYCLDNISINVFPVPDTGFPPKNLLSNPGFDALYYENNGGQTPIYWEKQYGADSQMQTAMGQLDGGYRSLLLQDTGSGSVGLSSESVTVTPGFNYTAGVNVKCINNPSTGAVYLRFFNDSDSIIQSTAATSHSSAWTNLTITAMAPENAVKAEVLCYVAQGTETGQVLFDNAFLKYADERIANGNWEGCSVGTLPDGWNQYSSSNPAASIQQDAGANVLVVSDTSSVQNAGACIVLPASPGVPYRLSSSARKTAGSAQMRLDFLDIDGVLISCEYLNVTSSTWADYEVKGIAPQDTCYVRAMFYCPIASVGTGMYKNVSLQEDYTLYYVSPAGTGNGQSYASPASYVSSSLWSDVDTSAQSHPVKVVFQKGNYNSANLHLDSVGNLQYAIVAEGEQPFGTVFNGIYGIQCYGSKNLILRNIHFISAPALSTTLMIGQDETETRNITVSDCHFVDMTNLLWSSVAIMWPETCNIAANDCIFIRLGRPTDSSHVFYNQHHSHNIDLIDNYFEDAWGSYVKTRNGSSGYRIIGNVFIQNNSYRTSSSKPFIHFTAYNVDGEQRDEILGTDYLIENNHFEYVNYPMIPLWIWVEGPTPVNHPGYHEITLTEKQTIENTANSDAVRNAEILENFGIDILNDWVIGSNTYYNANAMRLYMSRAAFTGVSTNISANLNALIE